MCGIAGRFNYISGRPVDANIVADMTHMLQHRGPDGGGVYVNGAVGMGHRRLAIIDLSDAGRQPMSSLNGRFYITFNGEIYNFRELRCEFESRGYQFRSNTDTEVILAAYSEYGAECLDKLRGMFAFAIWDQETRTLFIARDRVGKKPLYYLQNADGIAFASEPKAFFGDPAFTSDADLDAISHYLTYQAVPAPLSAFQGVKKLPPAHYILVKDGSLRRQRYWTLDCRTKLTMTEIEAAGQLRALLDDAVRCRLISDVPLGVFLSGGIDSATVAALMAHNSSARVKTFSIGFDEDTYNEVAFARLVAERYGTDHQELVVRPNVVEILPQLSWHYDEPFADPSAIPTFCLAQLTRRYVTVALNGDGGDESFAGYTRYAPSTGIDRYHRALPAVIRSAIEWTANALPHSADRVQLIGRVTRWLEAHGGSDFQRYAARMSVFRPRLKSTLCTRDFVVHVGPVQSTDILMSALKASGASHIVDAMMHADIHQYLPDVLLPKVDIATMAFGLEARSPFLDHVVMEFAARLPVDLKMRNGEGKYVLKKAVEELVPAPVITRPKKGFSVPLERWLRRELKDMTVDILLSRRSIERGLFEPTQLRRMILEHQRGTFSWHNQIWTLLMLELWYRQFIDTRPTRARTTAHDPAFWVTDEAATLH